MLWLQSLNGHQESRAGSVADHMGVACQQGGLQETVCNLQRFVVSKARLNEPQYGSRL